MKKIYWKKKNIIDQDNDWEILKIQLHFLNYEFKSGVAFS